MGRAKKNVEVEAQVIARGNVVPMMTETESEETVQYVSDEDAAREDRLVSEIRMITEQTKQVVLFKARYLLIAEDTQTQNPSYDSPCPRYGDSPPSCS